MGLNHLYLSMLPVVACTVLAIGCEGVLPEAVDLPTGTGNATSDELAVADGSVVPDELVVFITPGTDQEDLEALFSDQGATVRDRLTQLSVNLLGVDPTRRDEVRASLESSPFVEDVADNRIIDPEIVPNDVDYPLQWHLAAIEAPAAWATTTGSEQIRVAVLDTGVDVEHTDLAPNLLSGGNTFDGISGWQDVHGHGTAVAGVIAAAANNEEGVASVAWNSPIVPIRVTDGDNQTTSWALAAGIALAVDQGAKVINVSYSPSHHDDILLRQAELAHLAGSLVVFSAGNSGEQVVGGGSESALWVGAVDQDGSLASFSTFGDFVDLVAPGVSIYTTQLGNTYGTWSGASFAAPIVSGVAALVWSVNPDLRPTTVQGILLATATDLGPSGDDARFGAGQVNARAAVELAQAIVEQPDETPPAVSISRPADAAVVSGPTIVEVHVTDDNDVADVTLSLDGVPLAADAIAPYAFIIDTAKYAAGHHAISAVAADVFGNSSEHQITLAFADPQDKTPPAISIDSPREGSTVRGVITILADAADNRLLARAEVRVDGQVIDVITLGRVEARIAYNWDTSAPDVDAGPHTITIRVIDTSENAASASVDITVAK